MFKRRLIILCSLIISMILVYHAKSYTMAKIENPAELSITTSDKALIAVPEDLKLTVDKHTSEYITMELTDSGEKVADHIIEISYAAADNNLQIKNNMNEVINIVIKMDGEYKGIYIMNDSFTLSPGRAIENLNIKVDENVQEIPDNIDIKIYADWQGGTAVIDSQLDLTVNNIKPQINFNTLDLRTPVLEAEPLNIAPLNNDENNSDESTDNNENESYSGVIEDTAPIGTQKDLNECTNEESSVEDNDKNADENSNNSLENSAEEGNQEI